MPSIRTTKPDLDEQLPVALAARIAGIDRASLTHLIDHGLVPRLDLEAVRALATSGEVATKATDSPRHLVIRLDVDPVTPRITDMSDGDLVRLAAGPHRIPDSSVGRSMLISVRSFVIATGHIDSIDDPIPLRTDRRGREITGRTIAVSIDHRLTDLTTRPSKATEGARWLGRRGRVGTGGAILPLQT